MIEERALTEDLRPDELDDPSPDQPFRHVHVPGGVRGYPVRAIEFPRPEAVGADDLAI